jgi:hypothetical protein
MLDLAPPLAAVEFCDGGVEIAVAHQAYLDGGGFTHLRHRDVEMPDVGSDIGHDLHKLRLALAARAIGEHTHGRSIFPDAVDAAGEVKFRAERRLHEAFHDLAVGENPALRAPLGRNCGIFGRNGRSQECSAGNDRGGERRRYRRAQQ